MNILAKTDGFIIYLKQFTLIKNCRQCFTQFEVQKNAEKRDTFIMLFEVEKQKK